MRVPTADLSGSDTTLPASAGSMSLFGIALFLGAYSHYFGLCTFMFTLPELRVFRRSILAPSKGSIE